MPPQIALVIFSVFSGALTAGVLFYLLAKKSSERSSSAAQEDLKRFLDQKLELAQQKMENERLREASEIKLSRQAVELSVSKLSEELKNYEALMRRFEGERGEKYGFLDKGIRENAEAVRRLSTTTEGLKSLLDNSRARGQWGERMADDILRACGLQEGVQYLKNRAQENSSTRPDFTFLLPEGYKLNMDVKFPLDNYLRMTNARSETERAALKADFLKDVKARIRELDKRGYIDPQEQTLDYLLLFIPNEQVYGFIHEAEPRLIDEALKQKVLLCSPFTLYAVLAVVRQSFDNFHFAKATRELADLTATFLGDYKRFRDRFEDLGEKLDKTSGLYKDIEVKSFKQLESVIQKIQNVRQGQEQAAGKGTVPLSTDAGTSSALRLP